jgi:polar amino acid transport system substrate-binding protein
MTARNAVPPRSARRLRRAALGTVLALLAAVGGAGAAGASGERETLQLATLEWPPYTSASLPGQGPIVETIREAFDRAGIDIAVQIVPWKRAISRAKSEAHPAVGYFPGYHCRHDTGFVPSLPIGSGPVGLAERAADPRRWATLDDLEAMRIGVVAGYANTDAFDARVADGRITAMAANTDLGNLRQLADGGVDLAVIDSNVFNWLMAKPDADPSLVSALRMNARLLDDRLLYLCFADTAAGRVYRKRFDEAGAALDLRAAFARRFAAMIADGQD